MQSHITSHLTATNITPPNPPPTHSTACTVYQGLYIMLCSQPYPKCCAWTPLRAFIEHISVVWIIFSLSGSLVCTEQNTFNILKSNHLSHCTIECSRIISSPFCFWQTFKTWRLDWHLWAGCCSCSCVIFWDAVCRLSLLRLEMRLLL